MAAGGAQAKRVGAQFANSLVAICLNFLSTSETLRLEVTELTDVRIEGFKKDGGGDWGCRIFGLSPKRSVTGGRVSCHRH